MKTFTHLALLCAFAPLLAAACFENRPIVVGPDNGAPSQTGSAGASGAGGAPAQGGAAGNGSLSGGCNVSQLFGSGMGAGGSWGKYYCTVRGACHDAAFSATGLDMTSAGWEQKLLVTGASNGKITNSASLCLGTTEPYLIKGSFPAQGLFMDKLRPNPPCGLQMTILGGPISATDMECIQRWADAITGAGTGGTGNTGAAGAASGGAGMGSSMGCDITPLIQGTGGPTPPKYYCIQTGACHDGSAATAAGFSMLPADWPKLVGKMPMSSVVNGGYCGMDATYKTMPYIIAKSATGDGLIMQKLTKAICTPGQQMPTLGGPISATDKACFQAWATALANM